VPLATEAAEHQVGGEEADERRGRLERDMQVLLSVSEVQGGNDDHEECRQTAKDDGHDRQP
jgi:hypothetical protein